MKNSQSLKIEKRIRRELYKLPSWRRKYLFENQSQEDYLVRNFRYAMEEAKERGVKVDIRKALIQQSNQGVRSKREGTLRDIYRAFRTHERGAYARYNSYMYRKGYSASQYFYDPNNSEIVDEGYTTIVILELPRTGNHKYTRLIIEINWQFKNIENVIFS